MWKIKLLLYNVFTLFKTVFYSIFSWNISSHFCSENSTFWDLMTFWRYLVALLFCKVMYRTSLSQWYFMRFTHILNNGGSPVILFFLIYYSFSNILKVWKYIQCKYISLVDTILKKGTKDCYSFLILETFWIRRIPTLLGKMDLQF